MALHPARSTAAVLGAAAVGVLTWSTLIERRLFTLRRHTLPVLPESRTPVRVLQLSDLHLAPWQAQKVDWVRSLAELRPDLVVLTGDLMGHREALPALLHALRPVVEGTPTVFVHGSNDYYGPLFKNPLKYLVESSRRSTRTPDLDNAAITRGLTDLGAIDLNNSAAQLTIRGTRFECIGLNDPHIGYDDADRMRAAAARTFSEAPAKAGGAMDGAAVDSAAVDAAAVDAAAADAASAESAPVRLGVVHAPYQEALGALLTAGSDVMLAGHTHGGQVRVPGVGALTANCDLPTEQARGLSVWFDAHRAAFLNVSAGLGNSIYAPVRFACRPEASLLTLESA
ncbi:metallophosphoesterase [Leucobacter chromiiresistens]|uniref:Predicted phosphohydrolase, MPP superfamily n=1 Tax=Leucobacter chromiiresistens TaxID=1079994 RepID=A0A1H0YU95_9MICO|nr:metallophosphoesterase [Leucobacter chromiiresistens]SDQ18762.1 Predicted phosphohydrolase, MPP superfamily [Leucobacter chromiiresistens]